ncbi:MAG: transporter [Methylococcales bacterium]|nr:transporter [Methylococcales bacterium]
MSIPSVLRRYLPQLQKNSLVRFWLFLSLIALILVPPCRAMELAPRQWSHLPKGMNFAGIGYAYTEADISVDPVLNIEDVDMELHSWVAKYIHTFEVFDKSARIDVTQAYQEGKWSGLLNGVATEVSRRGFSDTFLRFATNLYGAPPLTAKEYGVFRKNLDTETIVGLGLVVRLPTGDYMDDKLINLGQNRFVLRPQLGVLHTRGKWTAELTGEIAFYTDNNDFFNGNRREQEPLYIVHGHLVHTFRPGLWAGVSFGYDYGGESTINGINKDDLRQDIGFAFNFAYPINRYSGIKVGYIRTLTQESVGVDTDTLTAAFSIMW